MYTETKKTSNSVIELRWRRKKEREKEKEKKGKELKRAMEQRLCYWVPKKKKFTNSNVESQIKQKVKLNNPLKGWSHLPIHILNAIRYRSRFKSYASRYQPSF